MSLCWWAMWVSGYPEIVVRYGTTWARFRGDSTPGNFFFGKGSGG